MDLATGPRKVSLALERATKKGGTKILKRLHVNLTWMVQVYNAAEALPNFVNPFWMLPLMGLTGVRARDLAGYSTQQLIFHLPVVLLMLWTLGKTLPCIAPSLS